MTEVYLPDPVIRPAGPTDPAPDLDIDALVRHLRAEVDGEIRFDAGSRGACSTDASSYRQAPVGVVVPKTVEDAARALVVCRRHRAPILPRGGGASLAVQCTNVAVVIDLSMYCTAPVSVDARARSCSVGPGIVLDDLNSRLS